MSDASAKEALIAAACQARANAYAPYSGYAVGAAVLTKAGHIFTGVNVENAAYPSSMCAERTAIYKMVSEGQRRVAAIAICTENGGSPCGACRQVLVEFAGDIPIYLSDEDGNVRESTLYALLPDFFGAKDLL